MSKLSFSSPIKQGIVAIYYLFIQTYLLKDNFENSTDRLCPTETSNLRILEILSNTLKY